MPKWKASLQARTILLVAVILFAMLAAVGISSYLAVQHSIQRALQERLSLAQTTANHLEYVINQSLRRLEDVSIAEGVKAGGEDLEGLRRTLRAAYFQTVFTEGLFITDSYGKVLWVEPYRPNIVSTSIYSYPHINQALESGRPVVSDVLIRNPSGRPVVSAVTPLKDRNGTTLGLVGGEVDITGNSLSSVLEAVQLGVTGYVDVVDSQGVVLATTEPSHLLTSSDHNNILADLIRRRHTAVSTCHSCHDPSAFSKEKRRVEVMAFAPFPTIPWGVSLRQEEDEVLAPARTLQYRLMLIGGIFSVPAFFLTWGLSRSIVRPLKFLSASARRIAEGNLNDSIPPLGQDEIGQLAHNLDSMRAALKESIARNQEWTRELEHRVQERTKELEESQVARGELLRKVISVQEEERKRIARELHDDTSQSLATLVMAIDTAIAAPSQSSREWEERLKNMKSLAVNSLEGTHQMIFNLRPAMLDDLGLLAALRWYAECRLQSQSTKVHVEVIGDEHRLPSQVETTVFRVCQEAINNIAKHAGATTVLIEINFKPSSLVVEIEDDGQGFDLSSIAAVSPTQGLGLLGMRERVNLIGGSLNISTKAGEGTRIALEVPYGQEVGHG